MNIIIHFFNIKNPLIYMGINVEIYKSSYNKTTVTMELLCSYNVYFPKFIKSIMTNKTVGNNAYCAPVPFPYLIVHYTSKKIMNCYFAVTCS